MKSYDNLAKSDVVFFSVEVENLETAVRTLVEVTSWMDWWFSTAKTLAMLDMAGVTMTQR